MVMLRLVDYGIWENRKGITFSREEEKILQKKKKRKWRKETIKWKETKKEKRNKVNFEDDKYKH